MIQELQTGILDINNKYTVDFSCKQLDDIILKIIVYDKSLPADLSDYNVRLKAFKADQVPLIQNTNISIKDNFVTIKASKQLTTTQGIVKAELQFINKTTLEKKSTFYINIEVVASVLDVDGVVSTPTCTILEEIDHKLDEIENIGQVLDEAKDVRDTLTNKTIPAATNINSKLESNINSVNTKITEVENIISSATSKIEEVETSINNADSSKKELDLSKTNADISKENLDTANTLAEKNIEELNSLGNVTDLAKNVQTNTTDIGTLKENVQTNTSQLKDLTNHLSVLSNPNLLINGDFQVIQRGYSFTTSGYTVDRWFATTDKGISIMSHKQGVIVKNTGVGSWHNFETRIEIPSSLQEATLTFTVKLNSAYVYRQIYINDRTNNKNLVAQFGTTAVTQDSVTFVVPNNCSILTLGIQVPEVLNAQLDIRYCKLEVGKCPTPLIAKSYVEELLACQRYYQICRVPTQTVLGDTNGQVAITVPLTTALRIDSPTIKAWAGSGVWLHPQTGGSAVDFLGSYLVNIYGAFQMLILENIGNPGIKNQTVYSINSSNEDNNISSGIGTITVDAEIY